MLTWFKNLFLKPESQETKASELASQLTFVVSKAEIIDQLKKRGRHATKADLINNALTVYSWALDAIDEGRVIGSINEREDTYRELSIPVFDQLKEQIPWGTWVDLDEVSCLDEDCLDEDDEG
jgi:hypothetical protein